MHTIADRTGIVQDNNGRSGTFRTILSSKIAITLHPFQEKISPNSQSNTKPPDTSKDSLSSTDTDASFPAKESAPDNRQEGSGDE